MGKCDNCRAWSAKVIVVNAGEVRQLLCIRCLKILKEMDKEYMNIINDVSEDSTVGANELTSTSHIGEKCSD